MPHNNLRASILSKLQKYQIDRAERKSKFTGVKTDIRKDQIVTTLISLVERHILDDQILNPVDYFLALNQQIEIDIKAEKKDSGILVKLILQLQREFCQHLIFIGDRNSLKIIYGNLLTRFGPWEQALPKLSEYYPELSFVRNAINHFREDLKAANLVNVMQLYAEICQPNHIWDWRYFILAKKEQVTNVAAEKELKFKRSDVDLLCDQYNEYVSAQKLNTRWIRPHHLIPLFDEKKKADIKKEANPSQFFREIKAYLKNHPLPEMEVMLPHSPSTLQEHPEWIAAPGDNQTAETIEGRAPDRYVLLNTRAPKNIKNAR